MRTAPTFARATCAALLALLLALRLLSPAGFMPAFEHGAVTIVVCPDTGLELAAPAPMHHHHGKAKHQPPCPYAAASSLGALGGDFMSLAALLALAIPLLLGRTYEFVERHSARLRPPLRGPPLPAA
jgi:hypothetical protein